MEAHGPFLEDLVVVDFVDFALFGLHAVAVGVGGVGFGFSD